MIAHQWTVQFDDGVGGSRSSSEDTEREAYIWLVKIAVRSQSLREDALRLIDDGEYEDVEEMLERSFASGQSFTMEYHLDQSCRFE